VPESSTFSRARLPTLSLPLEPADRLSNVISSIISQPHKTKTFNFLLCIYNQNKRQTAYCKKVRKRERKKNQKKQRKKEGERKKE